MATTKGLAARNVTISYGDGAAPNENFTAFAQITSMGLLSMTRETQDVTSLDSPEGFREFCGTLADAGELTFDVFFLPNEVTHNNLTEGVIAQFRDADNRSYRVNFNNANNNRWDMEGVMTGLSITGQINEVLTGSVTIKISGLPVFV